MTQVLKRMNLSQMKSDPGAFTGVDASGHVNLVVMAYVDDLVVSGESSSVQRFFQEIQKTFSLKHIDYLTPDHPIEFLGRVIKKRRSGQFTMEFSQKFIDNLLGLFKVTTKVTTNGVKIPTIPKEDQVKCDKESYSLFRTAVGKLLWMSQLRDDIKHPVKELSRSLSNPQESDLDNLKHLLEYLNQTQDFIFVMEPQIPAPKAQGLTPVEIISYSDSDWAGCRDQLAGHCLLCSQSLLHLQAEQRPQYHFIQEFRSAILSHDVKITVKSLKTDS